MNILEKIKKLIRLGTNNANEHEAELAMMKAQEIAIQNDIDIATISQGEENQKSREFVKNDKDMGQRLPICHKFVSSIIRMFFNVEIVMCGGRYNGRSLSFIGEADKVEFATWAYSYLNDVFINSWRTYKIKNSCPLAYRETYLFGLFKGLKDKLQKQKEELEKNMQKEICEKYSIVLVNSEKELKEATNNFFNNLKTSKSKTINVRNAAIAQDGFDDGQKINLNKVIA